MYPWLVPFYEQLIENRDRLPQALLILGPAGIGKWQLGLQTARLLLCQNSSENGICGDCERCRGYKKSMVPDLHLIVPEAFELQEPENSLALRYAAESSSTSKSSRAGQSISIRQIRLLIERLATHGYSQGQKVVLIYPASSLNINAANALLKILEEPPTQTRFLLISDDRNGMPATILSRVSDFSVSTPDADISHKWLLEEGVDESKVMQLLKTAAGGPLKALEFHHSDYLARSKNWKVILQKVAKEKTDPSLAGAVIGKDHVIDFVRWLENILTDAVLLGHGQRCTTLLDAGNLEDCALAERLYFKEIWDMIRKIQIYLRYQKNSADGQLFLEDVLIAIWQKA